MTTDDRPRVVIVGGGFGGLYAAKSLNGAFARVTVVDRRNHHVFQPLLYQVATAALNPSDIAVAIRHVLRHQENAEVLMADVRSIDMAAKKLVFADGGELGWDFLIVAAGATHSYFGNDAWEPIAPGLKTIEDATRIRHKILLAFERAERETDEAKRRAWLTFVVVGGGPTGVELAGAVAEIARHSLARDFRHIEPSSAQILLIEGQPHILPIYPDALRLEAERELAGIGVEVRGNSRVTAIDDSGVVVNGTRIASHTVLWAAGNRASPLAASLGVPLDRGGRVLVNQDLTISGRRDVFVIGDLAVLTQDGKVVNGLAPIAIQEGRHAALNVRRALRGEAYETFRYSDRGSFATIGRGLAVGQIFGKWNATGLPAWLAWIFIHIYFLIGFRNRLIVMIEWAFSYATWQRGARLITGTDRE